MKAFRYGWLALALTTFLAGRAAADIRLDANTRPTSQSIVLNIDSDKTDYTGSVRIELAVKRPTTTFQFHAEEMKLDRVVLSDGKGEIAVTIADGEDGLRTATCAREIGAGAYTLDIEFSKPFNTKAVGLYRMLAEKQGYIFTQLEAVDARKAFPCWDEPIVKIPYQMTITVPMQQEVVTNTPVEKQTMGAGTKTYLFKKTPPMPSYLLAVAAGPLESTPIPGLSVPGRVYTVRGQKHLTKMATQIAPPILAALEKYFGREYPYEKLDLIAIPEYWPGAMENPGAVTFVDNILLVDDKAASISQKRSLFRVTAHEFAHMWFGDLVTMAWWDDLWLNESFADWLGDKITDELHPEYKQQLSELQDVQGVMSGDARPSTVPVRKPVHSTADMMEGVRLAYGKGKTVLGMVEVWIGSDAFQTGVRNYINAHAWGNTEAADLFSALSAAAGKDLEPVLGSFLENAGFPLVTVRRASGGVITVSQQRFLNEGAEADAKTWSIPVRLKYSDGKQMHERTVLLDKESTSVELGSNVAWVMPNQGSYGYYRWSAPPEMLFAIAENPMVNLDERERAIFLANAGALMTAGEMAGDDYMNLISIFAQHPEPEVVEAVTTALGGVKMAFVTDDVRDAFSHYIRVTLQPALDRYGLEAKANEPETVSLQRPDVISWLGEDGGDAAVRAHCHKLAKKYMADAASVDATLAGTALSVAAVDGTRDDFDAYRQHFEQATVPADRSRYLRAMGNFSDPALQDEALRLVASGAVRPNEAWQITRGIGHTEAGRTRSWKWLQDNYEVIAGRLPPEFRSYLPYMVSGCSVERLKAAQAFFLAPERNVTGMDRSMNKVGDQVMDCARLREREGAKVAAYLMQMSMAH